MRDCGPSQPKASPAPPRHTPAPSLSMASRHSGPSGAEEGASCSEGPGGSVACPSLPCNPSPETRGASSSGTSENTLSGKPEPGASAKGAPSSPENGTPVFLDKTDSKSLKQMNPTSIAKGELGSLGKVDPTPTDKTEPVSVDKGCPVVPGVIELVTPKKEEPGYLGLAGPVGPSKGDVGPPGKQGPRNSGKEPLDSSKEANLASPEKQSGPLEERDATCLPHTSVPAGKKESEASGILTAGASGMSEPLSLGALDPGTSGKVTPQHLECTETVTPAKWDPQYPGKRAPASSETEAPISVTVRPATSLGQVGSTSPGPVELTSSTGVTEAASSGKEGLGLPKKTDPISEETTKAPAPGNTNPESSRKRDPISSSLGDSTSLGPGGTLSPVKATVDSGGRAGPLSPEKSGLLSLGGVGPGAKGTTDTGPSSPNSSTKWKAEPGSEAQAAPASGQAEALQKRPQALEKMDLGPLPSGKVGAEALGKAGSPPLEKVAPLTLEKQEASSSRQADSKVCGAASTLAGAGSGTGRVEPRPEPSTQASSTQASSTLVPSTQASSTLVPSTQASSTQVPSTQASSTLAIQASNTRAPSIQASGQSQKVPATPGGAEKSPAMGDHSAPCRASDSRQLHEGAILGRERPAATTTRGRGHPGGRTGSCVSVALSPMSPQDGAGGPAFSFQAAPHAPSPAPTPAPGPPTRRDAGLQVSLGVAETRSVATGPMTPQAAAPPTAPPVFPEVRVRPGSALAAAIAPPEAAEPVRDVSWDEKGMTWEVYGAAMEVEVLGMAIQKHLERQIEEHGRQGTPAPQASTRLGPGPGRAGSVRAAPPDGTNKRPPGLFRALLQSVRRPRCCSRAGPTAE